jgi:hypothetical protein
MGSQRLKTTRTSATGGDRGGATYQPSALTPPFAIDNLPAGGGSLCRERGPREMCPLVSHPVALV